MILPEDEGRATMFIIKTDFENKVIEMLGDEGIYDKGPLTVSIVCILFSSKTIFPDFFDRDIHVYI